MGPGGGTRREQYATPQHVRDVTLHCCQQLQVLLLSPKTRQQAVTLQLKSSSKARADKSDDLVVFAHPAAQRRLAAGQVGQDYEQGREMCLMAITSGPK